MLTLRRVRLPSSPSARTVIQTTLVQNAIVVGPDENLWFTALNGPFSRESAQVLFHFFAPNATSGAP